MSERLLSASYRNGSPHIADLPLQALLNRTVRGGFSPGGAGAFRRGDPQAGGPAPEEGLEHIPLRGGAAPAEEQPVLRAASLQRAGGVARRSPELAAAEVVQTDGALEREGGNDAPAAYRGSVPQRRLRRG